MMKKYGVDYVDVYGKLIGSNYELVDVKKGNTKSYKEGGMPLAGGYSLTHRQEMQGMPFNPDNFDDVQKCYDMHKGQTFNSVIGQYEKAIAPIQVITKADGTQSFRSVIPTGTAIADLTYSEKEQRTDKILADKMKVESLADAQTLLDVICAYAPSGQISECAGATSVESISHYTEQHAPKEKSSKRKKAEAIGVGIGVGLAVTIPAALVVLDNNPGLFDAHVQTWLADIAHAKWNNTGVYDGTATGTTTVNLANLTLEVLANLTASQPTGSYANISQGLVNVFFTDTTGYSGDLFLPPLNFE
jgi:hypothetical protein